MVKKSEFVHIHQKPRLRPKPGQAKPDFWLLARLTISSSQSHLKPGQSQGFQAKPEPAHHYLYRQLDGWIESNVRVFMDQLLTQKTAMNLSFGHHQRMATWLYHKPNPPTCYEARVRKCAEQNCKVACDCGTMSDS